MLNDVEMLRVLIDEWRLKQTELVDIFFDLKLLNDEAREYRDLKVYMKGLEQRIFMLKNLIAYTRRLSDDD